MKCIYDTGTGCNLFDNNTINNPNGCSEDGFCRSADDPNPEWCNDYESNNVCIMCEIDFNNDDLEECNCE